MKNAKFEEPEVVHEAREANLQAPILARASVSLAAGRYLWLSTVPNVLVLLDINKT